MNEKGTIRGTAHITIVRNICLTLFAAVFCCIALIYLEEGEIRPVHFTQSPTQDQRQIASQNGSNMVLRYKSGWTDLADSGFLAYIRKEWIVEPSKKAYNLQSKDAKTDTAQFGQGEFVDKVLGKKNNGFFVECGAATGEIFSNTLRLERLRGWSGLLIEANPDSFQTLLKKNRKAYAVNSCLSLTNETGMVHFLIDRKGYEGFIGGIESGFNDKQLKSYKDQLVSQDVQCFPFFAILQAIGVSHIDFFSLDVEGPELDILDTIPFDKIYIDVITLEFSMPGNKKGWTKADEAQREVLTLQKLQQFRDFFARTGLYKEIGILPWGTHENKQKQEKSGHDVLFKRI